MDARRRLSGLMIFCKLLQGGVAIGLYCMRYPSLTLLPDGTIDDNNIMFFSAAVILWA